MNNPTGGDIAAPQETAHLLRLPYDFIPGAAIFDCDGTLADTMPLHYQAWREALDPIGCPFPEDQFYAWGGIPTRDILIRLNAQHGMTMDPDAMTHHKEEIYRALIPQVGPVPAIVAEVQRLHGRCPLAVASGGIPGIIAETLRSLDLARYFDVVVTSEAVTRGKPAPDIFLHAARLLNVPPSECVAYEDAPPGLEAARRAGMRVVDVRPYYMG